MMIKKTRPVGMQQLNRRSFLFQVKSKWKPIWPNRYKFFEIKYEDRYLCTPDIWLKGLIRFVPTG